MLRFSTVPILFWYPKASGFAIIHSKLIESCDKDATTYEDRDAHSLNLSKSREPHKLDSIISVLNLFFPIFGTETRCITSKLDSGMFRFRFNYETSCQMQNQSVAALKFLIQILAKTIRNSDQQQEMSDLFTWIC